MRISAAISPMRINEMIRPMDDTGLASYSEIVMTLTRPHSEQRTVMVRRSGPMSMPFRASDSQCGHSTTRGAPSGQNTSRRATGSAFGTPAVY